MIEAINLYKNRVTNQKQIVTIFMLTHNREKYVKMAIDGVLSQTYSNFTLIILDNCSTDNTKDVIHNIKDDRVIYIYRESKVGDSNSQFAFDNCMTKYMIILHDDDIVKNTYLEEILNVIEKNDYTAVSTSAELINENGEVIGHKTKRSGNFLFQNSDYLYERISFKSGSITMLFPSVIYRTEFFQRPIKFVDLSAGPANDQLLWFQAERYGAKLFFYNKELMSYRVHTNQDSRINADFMDLQLLDYLLKDEYYYNKLKELNLDIPYRFLLYRFRNLCLRYNKKKIDKDLFSSFFNYTCVKHMRASTKGMILYLTMRIIWYTRGLSTPIISILGK